MCHDRLGAGLQPACATACPTESIQFGPLDELRDARPTPGSPTLHERGVPEARLYGHDPDDGVGGDGAFFLLLDEPEVYGLPPDPVVTTRDLPSMWRHAAAAALTVAATVAAAFLGGGDDRVETRAGAGRGERLMVPDAEFTLLLRAADHQEPHVEGARRPALPLPRRRRGRVRAAGGARRRHRAPALRRVGPRSRRWRAALVSVGALVHDLGRPRAVPAHAAGAQADLAAVGRARGSSRRSAPCSGLAAASELTGIAPAVGRAAGLGAAVARARA